MVVAHAPRALAAARRSGFSFTRIILPSRGVAPVGAVRGKYSATTFLYCSQSSCYSPLQCTSKKALLVGPMVMGRSFP